MNCEKQMINNIDKKRKEMLNICVSHSWDIQSRYKFLGDSIRALIIVAQEPPISTKAESYHSHQKPCCRLVKDGTETVQLRVSGAWKLTSTTG